MNILFIEDERKFIGALKKSLEGALPLFLYLIFILILFGRVTLSL